MTKLLKKELIEFLTLIKDMLSAIAVIGLSLGFAYGWIMNIVQLVQNGDAYTTVIVVVKVCGIFVAPLGVVMGYVG